jgi:hypothetical protein
MAKLIVGRFDNIVDATHALDALPAEGFALREYGLFYVGPPGQHAIYPIGGDAYSDEGAKDAGKGAVAGAALGGAAGLAVGAATAAALPFAGVVAVLAATGVGAYIGSLFGALSQTESGDPDEATPEHPVEQPGGPRIAICVDRPGTEPRAIEILKRFRAKDVSRAEGEWHEGNWKDFDPRVPGEPVDTSQAR